MTIVQAFFVRCDGCGYPSSSESPDEQAVRDLAASEGFAVDVDGKDYCCLSCTESVD